MVECDAFIEVQVAARNHVEGLWADLALGPARRVFEARGLARVDRPAKVNANTQLPVA